MFLDFLGQFLLHRHIEPFEHFVQPVVISHIQLLAHLQLQERDGVMGLGILLTYTLQNFDALAIREQGSVGQLGVRLNRIAQGPGNGVQALPDLTKQVFGYQVTQGS